MTGFGSATTELAEAIIKVEIKSLNSKGLDLSVRLPRGYYDKEMEVRSLLSHDLYRGKVNINIEIESTGTKALQRIINPVVIDAMIADAKATAKRNDIHYKNILPSLLMMNEVYQNNQSKNDETEWTEVIITLKKALESYEEFRKQEGYTLQLELESYVKNIDSSLTVVDAHKDNRIVKVKSDLQEKLKQIAEDVKFDMNRLEQELIYFAEKLDITEEIVRLRSHLKYFLSSMNEPTPGKKLGFIGQEMGREINTIGSKANDATIQRDIVMMKEELEKIKEQVLNIL